MALYFLSYDLRKSRDYQPLYDQLAAFAATRVLESVWCFQRTNTDCANLTNFFRKLLDADDGLLLIDAKQWAGLKLDGNPPSTWSQ
nr:hypothetical protein 11 [bacterium]